MSMRRILVTTACALAFTPSAVAQPILPPTFTLDFPALVPKYAPAPDTVNGKPAKRVDARVVVRCRFTLTSPTTYRVDRCRVVLLRR